MDFRRSGFLRCCGGGILIQDFSLHADFRPDQVIRRSRRQCFHLRFQSFNRFPYSVWASIVALEINRVTRQGETKYLS